MRTIKMTHILGVVAVAGFVIGCGKGFEPPKFDGSLKVNNSPNPSEATRPAERTNNPDYELMATTVRAVNLTHTEGNNFQLDTLIHLDDQNVYETRANFNGMEEGTTYTVGADKLAVRSLIELSEDAKVIDVANVLARCLEQCAIVEVNMRLESDEVAAILGKSLTVTMRFKKDVASNSYLVDHSDAGQVVGSGVQEYEAARIQMEGEIEARKLGGDEADADTEVDADKVEGEEAIEADAEVTVEGADTAADEVVENVASDDSDNLLPGNEPLPDVEAEVETGAETKVPTLGFLGSTVTEFFNKFRDSSKEKQAEPQPKATSASKNGENQY